MSNCQKGSYLHLFDSIHTGINQHKSSTNINKIKGLHGIHKPLKDKEETLDKSVESSSHRVLVFCNAIVADDEAFRYSFIS